MHLERISFLYFALSVSAALHESLPSLPFGWFQSPLTVSDSTPIVLQVVLQYQNINQLEILLAGVSTPGSPTYGHYYDLAAQTATFDPSAVAVQQVKTWLQQAGAESIVCNGSIVSFKSTVGQANSMLGTKFDIFTNGVTKKLRTTAYSVPDHLTDVIDLVFPTTYFGNSKSPSGILDEELVPMKTTSQRPSKRQLQTSCETTYVSKTTGQQYPLIGPECLKELYDIGGYMADPKSGSTIAFGSFLNQSASYSDLALFEQKYEIPAQNFSVTLLNGGVNDQNPATESDGEANLDVQNIIGLVDGLPVREYITGGVAPFIPDLLSPTQADDTNEPYLQYYQYLLSRPNSDLPYVISNSYGDHENTVPERYAKRVCNMIGLMGLRGRTILESSGDEGVGAVCRDNQGSMEPQFTPQFPGTCPYVTAIGGTQFYNPEYAWNASSGGFSFYFPTAFYQKSAVQTYLAEHISQETREYYASNNYTNFAGRGFPDISAHSLYPYYLTYINGTVSPNGGTSAAAPVVAAIIALLNDARLRAGKPAMGFINPFLYGVASAAEALNDIVNGTALGCQGIDLQNGIKIPGAGIIPFASWNATVGWDPATGLGTPDFQKLKALALAI